MKSEHIKHSLGVGPKSIQSRVYDRETNEVISFAKIPLEEAGLVRREWVGLTKQDAEQLVEDCDWYNDPVAFCFDIEAKLKEKNHD